MKKISDMNIPELERAIKKNWKDSERIDRERERLQKALTKRLAERYKFHVNDIIVGRAVVFNKKRSIIAKISNITRGHDWQEDRVIIKVIAYTPADKRYEFDITKIRRARISEVKKYHRRYQKWIGR